MARPGPQTFAKRQRELKKREKKRAKREKRARRKELKEKRAAGEIPTIEELPLDERPYDD